MILSENSTKQTQQSELQQLAVFLALREHTKTLRLYFSLNSVIDWWLREFCRSFWLKEDNSE